jgi:hypothetical protein
MLLTCHSEPAVGRVRDRLSQSAGEESLLSFCDDVVQSEIKVLSRAKSARRVGPTLVALLD